MDLADAPFHADLPGIAMPARAMWARAADGVRLRIGHFATAAPPRGTVLILPGRTEYIEKYSIPAATLTEAGFHVLTLDWRGQGLADRLLDDPLIGHVDHFTDYQLDFATLRATADALDLPAPCHMIAHSMGGCIGLRALVDGADIGAAVFTGPMWGISLSAAIRPAALAIGWSSRQMGFGGIPAPGTGPLSYVGTAPFADNTLTTDPGMWATMRDQVRARPALALGGPSMRWLHEALIETRALTRAPSPGLPALCFLGGNERIVDTARIRDRMARWTGGKLDVLAGKEHEVLMEDRVTRDHVLGSCMALFDR